MTSEPWTGHGPVLVDTSAWIASRRVAAAGELLAAAVDRGEVAWCWPVRYELTIEARGEEGVAAVDRVLDGLREIAVDRAVQRAVLQAMRELATTGPHGAHRFPLTDLTVAVAAQAAGIDVVHHDHHFDRLGELLGVTTWWIAGAGARTQPSH